MKSATVEMKAHLAREVTSLCTCWRIERTDGVVLCCTDHDQDLVYAGQVYTAATGYERTAITSDVTLAVDNLDLNGIIDSDFITEEDLRNGVYDYASVEVFLVNWDDLTMDRIKLRRGWFGEVRISPTGTFKVELRGLTQLLANNAGRFFQPECGSDLGDKWCRVLIDPPARAPSAPVQVGDRVRAAVLDGAAYSVAAPLANTSFDADGKSGWFRSIQGWTTEKGWPRLQPMDGVRIVALDGGYWVEGYDWDNAISQTFTTESINLNPIDIDGGQVTAEAASWHVNREDRSSTQMEVLFLDVHGAVLDSYDTGTVVLDPLNVWVRKAGTITVPAGTRSCKVRLSFKKFNPFNSVDWYVRAGIDAISLMFSNAAGTISDSRRFKNVEFVCTVAGTTSSDPIPSFTSNIGDVIVDGGVMWQCQASKYVAASTIKTVQSRRQFTLDPDLMGPGLAAWPLNFFQYGVLSFESGQNKGRHVEIESWDPATMTIVTQFQTVYDLAVGDVVSFHAGCNKDIDTCATKFQNGVNFRGFPNVPGNEFFINGPTG